MLSNSILSDLLPAVLILLLIIVIAYYSRKISQLNRKLSEVQLDSQRQAQQLAQQYSNSWLNQYSAQLRQQLEQSLRLEYEAKLQEWKGQNEQLIRKDAVMRSVNTLLGKIGEEFAPFLIAEKYQVNPKDFRHLGSPVDYVAFKGLSDNNVEPEVIFIEVKAGRSTTLTDREKKIRDAVNKKMIRYEVINLNDLIGEAQKKISEEVNKM
ncbi:Holliday junction resolvase-like protein [Sulfuracidifex metallicus]|uniref:Holliday junction resolvase-like protein n=1 Tax=Sulfuracidifex metallicus TaxID=47303 RepID=UPI002274C1DB|nr:Holliday junction resolvase-like protein [Sulfuracidifex metallicus]MCY0849809.1 endonuclease [Sulfuracidifex metallicus]